MPDVEEKKQDLVDIDTSGPGADVELEEDKVTEVPTIMPSRILNPATDFLALFKIGF